MPKFKIKKRFVDSDKKEYLPNDIIELDNRMKIDRMIIYGIIEWEPIKQKKRGRKRKIERAVVL